jgi:hypothetical protein
MNHAMVHENFAMRPSELAYGFEGIDCTILFHVDANVQSVTEV